MEYANKLVSRTLSRSEHRQGPRWLYETRLVEASNSYKTPMMILHSPLIAKYWEGHTFIVVCMCTWVINPLQ